MTGPEHYKAAEECLESAAKTSDGDDAQTFAAMAQAHATLALAAATALGNATETDRTGWRLAMRDD